MISHRALNLDFGVMRRGRDYFSDMNDIRPYIEKYGLGPTTDPPTPEDSARNKRARTLLASKEAIAKVEMERQLHLEREAARARALLLAEKEAKKQALLERRAQREQAMMERKAREEERRRLKEERARREEERRLEQEREVFIALKCSSEMLFTLSNRFIGEEKGQRSRKTGLGGCGEGTAASDTW